MCHSLYNTVLSFRDKLFLFPPRNNNDENGSFIFMTLEEEMRREIAKLGQEISELDREIERFTLRLSALQGVRKKKERDNNILKASFNEGEAKEIQTTLAKHA